MIDGDCQTFVSDCHVRTATELLSHSWDPVVLSALRLGPTQRKELFHRIGDLSDKVLTESLRRLSVHGLIAKTPISESATRGGDWLLRHLPLRGISARLYGDDLGDPEHHLHLSASTSQNPPTEVGADIGREKRGTSVIMR